jgi:5-methyltetrahydropteroyltriglutamate--homocysteine methyltransferase
VKEIKTMASNPGRILTTHAGSLPRPRSLIDIYVARSNGESIDEAVLDAEGEAATQWVVDRQREAGVDIPSDGEQVREAFFLYLQRRMTGFGSGWDRPAGNELNNYPEFKAQRREVQVKGRAVSNLQPPMAIGPVTYVDKEANAAEIATFKSALSTAGDAFADAFMTAPSPGIVATAIKNDHYENDDDYLDALADALAFEYKAAVDAGFILQIDAPDLGLERHMLFHDKPLSTFIAFVDKVIARINRMIEGLPRDRVRLHVCYGNYESPHDQDVPLGDILPSLLQANVGGFLFPFANPRHTHEIKLFRNGQLANDQYLIVGAVDTLTAFVEHPEVIADRLELAADALGDPSRVMAGTDCGFDTSAGMGRLTSDVVWAKLRALSDGAALASKRLF